MQPSLVIEWRADVAHIELNCLCGVILHTTDELSDTMKCHVCGRQYRCTGYMELEESASIAIVEIAAKYGTS